MDLSDRVASESALGRSITFEVTRGDLFAGFLTVILRNRILQVYVFALIIIFEAILVGPFLYARSLFHNVVLAITYLLAYFMVLVISMTIIGLAQAFLPKQRGVIGQQTLEITEQGLIGRSDFNESLHRWPAICKILSRFGYLYIYVSDSVYHQVPKRCLSRQELAAFESELRKRAADK